MIWCSLIIPIICIYFTYYYFKHRITWFEIPIPIVCTLIFIFLCRFIYEESITSDIEYLTDQVTKVEYYEEFTEEWTEIETYTEEVNGKTETKTRLVTHTQYNPEKWFKISPSRKITISKNEYDRLKNKWGNEVYKDLFHYRQRHGWGDGRGDMFYVRAGKGIESLTWTQRYKNKIQASNSLFNNNINKAKYNYPPIKDGITNCILGVNDPIAEDKLRIWNSLIGPRPAKNYKKACRIWILHFDRIDEAVQQEHYWLGGNKNEFIVCLGPKDPINRYSWCYVFSWTLNEHLKSRVKQFVLEQKDLVTVVDYVGQACYDDFERREFSEFDYLHIKLPIGFVIFTCIFSFCISILTCYICVQTEN